MIDPRSISDSGSIFVLMQLFPKRRMHYIYNTLLSLTTAEESSTEGASGGPEISMPVYIELSIKVTNL